MSDLSSSCLWIEISMFSGSLTHDRKRACSLPVLFYLFYLKRQIKGKLATSFLLEEEKIISFIKSIVTSANWLK